MKRKVIRAITGLLCAAMFFSNVAGMSVYAMEDGAGQEMQESISGNDDTGEAWEEPEETEQESADSDAEPEAEIPEEPDETETVSENTVEEKPEEKAILSEIFLFRRYTLPGLHKNIFFINLLTR